MYKMEGCTTIWLIALCAAGSVAKATNHSVAASSDQNSNNFLDMRERIDHLEEKLDAAACKLENKQTEMAEKLHSFESLFEAKLETLELRLGNAMRTELRDQLDRQMDRMLTKTENLLHAKLNTFQPGSRTSSGVKAVTPLVDTPGENGSSVLNQSSLGTEFYDVISGIENQLRTLTKSSEACAAAAQRIQSEEPAAGMTSPHEWIPILRRMTGRVNFSRSWEEYKTGFGDLGGEFWLGLENIYQLTSRRSHRLRVVLTDFSGSIRYAEYRDFYIQGEAVNYRLHVTGYTSGSNPGDSLAVHNGQYFTTYDRDNDSDGNKNCADNERGGWWYEHCGYSQLTGQYLPHSDKSGYGIKWYHAYKDLRSFKAAEMSIREE